MAFLVYTARGHFSVSSDIVLECPRRRLGRGQKELESRWHLSVNSMRRQQQIRFFQSAVSPTSHSTATVREDRPSCPG